MNLGRYVLAGDNTVGNVFSILANTVTRTWDDRAGTGINGDYVPALRPASIRATNGECGAMSDFRFGTQVPSTAYDPDVLDGWGKRAYNWEFSAGVQHELSNRVGLDVGYFRRFYGNFIVTDNLAVAASDYTAFSITAPVDPRLPGGGGYAVSGLYDLNPNKVGQVEQLRHVRRQLRQADRALERRRRHRERAAAAGMLLQGGVSTGRTSTDNCEVLDDGARERAPLNRLLPRRHELPDPGQAARHLHRAEGRRAVLGDLPEPAGTAGDGQLHRAQRA